MFEFDHWSWFNFNVSQKFPHIHPVDIIHGAGLIIIIALPSISISFGYYDISMLCFHNIKREPNNKISRRPNSKTNSSKQKAWLRKLQSFLEVCIIYKEYILYIKNVYNRKRTFLPLLPLLKIS